MIKRTILYYLLGVGLLLASGGVIVLISTNPVSNNGLSNPRWEPTSAAGSNWVHGWVDWISSSPAVTQAWVASWNGSAWNAPIQLSLPPAFPYTLDLVINWDAFDNRFVLAMIDAQDGVYHSVWYGYSNDAAGNPGRSGKHPCYQPAPVV